MVVLLVSGDFFVDFNAYIARLPVLFTLQVSVISHLFVNYCINIYGIFIPFLRWSCTWMLRKIGPLEEEYVNVGFEVFSKENFYLQRSYF